MLHIPLKALSVNQAYRGRRFATKELTQYKQDISRLLPKMEIPAGKLAVTYIFGTSSKGSDGDNLIKCLQDALAEAYGFNDNRIYRWMVEKRDVKKREEYIEIKIEGA